MKASIFPVLFMCACSCREEPVDTQDPRDTEDTTETGEDTSGDLACNHDWQEAPAGIPAAEGWQGSDDLLYRVVRIETSAREGTTCAVVFYPSDPTWRAYVEGAPVHVMVPTTFHASAPRPFSEIAHGIIEVQPVYPGLAVDDCRSSGTNDNGGADTLIMVQETIAFAAGLRTTEEGWTLGHLAGMDVCNRQVSVFGTSSGGMTAYGAVATAGAEIQGVVLGIGGHETPSNPQFVNGEGGWSWEDPNDAVDADDNGYTWDDARNYAYVPGQCGPETCDLDYSALRYTEDVLLSDIHATAYGPASGQDGGVLYLDLDGNGRLSLADDGCVAEGVECSLDVDGNGAFDEDFFIWPANADEGDHRLIYSPEVLRAAVAQGVLSEGAWPEEMFTVAEAEAFWSTRNMAAYADELAVALGTDAPMLITFTEEDHGVALPSRPHVWQVYEALRAAGFAPQYNVPAALAECLVGRADLFTWAGEVAPGTALAEDELENWALPENIPDKIIRSIGQAAVFWRTWGPFDRCPGS